MPGFRRTKKPGCCWSRRKASAGSVADKGPSFAGPRHPEPLTSLQVLDIFRCKTAPAFEVALRFGAIYANKDEEVSTVLGAYSEALGIAYQIRDDLSDLGSQGETNDIAGLRPSLLLAVAYERAKGDKKELLESLWRRTPHVGANAEQIEALYTELKADERARTLLETYKEEAIRSLRQLENANLKGLLRRVIGKIFNDTEIKGWCKEFEEKTRRNAPATVRQRPSPTVWLRLEVQAPGE